MLFPFLLGPISPALAQQIALPFEVIFIPKKALFNTFQLETTVSKPSGPGPFPLVIINHGKSLGPPESQPRYFPGWAVRYFIERGYVVFMPMRPGFSKSTGSYVAAGCNIESTGLHDAEVVAATVAFAHTLSYVDRTQTLVVGQSAGGWTTLAYGAAKPDPSVKGLVNFAGGLRMDSCRGWQLNLAKAAASYAENTQIPSLWFYGDNDSYFIKDVYSEIFTRYSKVNPQAHLVAFGEFGQDSHSLFGSKDGRAIWQPHLEKFMAQLGLPVKVIYPQYQPGK
ncbi:MAG: dienelactone hydrolase family protein [Acetobacteraceae bacterium]|nr:dienelactone hydrolase family protein [Acetobacteraceae bacterium]